MSELLKRAIKLADEAELLAKKIRHSEAVTIDGKCEVVQAESHALENKSHRGLVDEKNK